MRTGFADLFGDSDVDDGQGELVGVQDLHQRLQRLGLVRRRRHANGAHHRQIGVGQQLQQLRTTHMPHDTIHVERASVFRISPACRARVARYLNERPILVLFGEDGALPLELLLLHPLLGRLLPLLFYGVESMECCE